MSKLYSKAVCFHEAGHAAVGAAIGREVTPVEVRHDGSGLVHGTARVEVMRGQYAVWDYAAYCLAGPLAEARATKTSNTWVRISRGGPDEADAMLALEWLVECGFSENRHVAFQRAYEHTRYWISREWPVITGLADALRVCGRLEAEAVQSIVTKHRVAA